MLFSCFRNQVNTLKLVHLAAGRARIGGSIITVKCMSSSSFNGQVSLAHKWIGRTAKILGAGVLAAGVLVAALPAILSTRLGLSASLAAANVVLPGQVEVSDVQLGWTKPLKVKGLKLKDRASRGGLPLMDVEELSCTAGLWEMAQAAGVAPSGGGTSSSAATSGACCPLIVQGAVLNCEYDPTAADWKLLEWLEAAGILSSSQAQQQGDHAALDPLGILNGSAGDSSSGSNETGIEQKSAAGPTTAGNREQAKRSDGGISASPTSVAESTPANEGSTPPGAVFQMLSHADSIMDFSADVRLGPSLQVLLPDGHLKVPQEVRDMLGAHLHLTGAFGVQPLQEWAEEVGQEIDWVLQDSSTATGIHRSSSSSSSSDSSGTATAPASHSDAGGSTGDASALKWSATAIAAGCSRQAIPAGYEPGILQVHSNHLRAEMKLYRSINGTGPVLLHEPASATVEFTPALCSFGLSAVNPLLSRAVAVQASSPAQHSADDSSQSHTTASAMSTRGSEGMPPKSLHVLFAPDGLQLPYQGALLLVGPMRLTLAGGGLIEELCSALDISASAAHKRIMEMQVSPMQVYMQKDGPIATNRVDMLIGSGSKSGSLELSLWGTHHPATGALDMVVGLPEGALRAVGLRDLPAGYVLPLTMRGTVDRPSMDYKAAAGRLASLVLRENLLRALEQDQQVDTGILGRVLGAVGRAVVPDKLAVIRRVEADMARDMARIPKP